MRLIDDKQNMVSGCIFLVFGFWFLFCVCSFGG